MAKQEHDQANGTAKRAVLTPMVALSGFCVTIVRGRQFRQPTDPHETFLKRTMNPDKQRNLRTVEQDVAITARIPDRLQRIHHLEDIEPTLTQKQLL